MAAGGCGIRWTCRNCTFVPDWSGICAVCGDHLMAPKVGARQSPHTLVHAR